MPVLQVATAAGTDSILVPGAGVMESQAVTSAVGKKTGAATPVPTVLVPVVPVVTHTPAATVPPVAVSGQTVRPVGCSCTVRQQQKPSFAHPAKPSSHLYLFGRLQEIHLSHNVIDRQYAHHSAELC